MVTNVENVNQLNSLYLEGVYMETLLNKIDMKSQNIALINVFSRKTPSDGGTERLCLDASLILRQFPSLKIDSELDPLILDTKPYIIDFKMPYPAFFVNKKFETEKGTILGIYVYDKLETTKLLLKMVLSRGPEHTKDPKYMKDVKMLQGEVHDLENDKANGVDITHRIKVMCPILNTTSQDSPLAFYACNLYSLGQSANMQCGKIKTEFLNRLCKHDAKIIFDHIMQYAINVANLLTSQVDLANPTNTKHDIRVYTDNTGVKKEDRRNNHNVVVKVFGDTKKYVDAYNTEKKRHYKTSMEACIVRGHYRHLQSERYKAKRGETIWIPPFYKGMDKELYSRIVKIVP